MALDPRFQAELELAQTVEDWAAIDPVGFRKWLEKQSRLYEGAPQEVASVRDVSIPGADFTIAARVYTPTGGTEPRPAIVFFHGGGWVIGSLNTHDKRARALANASGAVVVAVDYRLAPEHKFPCAAEDAYLAVSWVASSAAALGVDAARLAVFGDSAGANLSTVAALMARERGGPALAAQILICPVTNYAFDTQSYASNGQGYNLTTDSMRWFWGHYLRSDADGASPYASPLRASSLAGLPPAVVITAEFDPLRDEGEAYAAALSAAGVPVVTKRYDGMIHGFTQRPLLVPEVVEDAMVLIAKELSSAFGC